MNKVDQDQETYLHSDLSFATKSCLTLDMSFTFHLLIHQAILSNYKCTTGGRQQANCSQWRIVVDLGSTHTVQQALLKRERQRT